MENNQEEFTIKNFLKNYVMVFFTSNQKVHKTLNYSRIYNTYWNILEVMQIILLYVVYMATLQSFSIVFFTILICLTIVSNFIIRIGNNYYLFKYLIILSTVILLIQIAPIYFTVQGYLLINTLCSMINNYQQHNNQSYDACQKQYALYYSWFSMMGVYFIIRIFGFYLAYRAYKFLFEKHNAQELKKQRKLRYIELCKVKKSHKGENYNYGERRM